MKMIFFSAWQFTHLFIYLLVFNTVICCCLLENTDTLKYCNICFDYTVLVFWWIINGEICNVFLLPILPLLLLLLLVQNDWSRRWRSSWMDTASTWRLWWPTTWISWLRSSLELCRRWTRSGRWLRPNLTPWPPWRVWTGRCCPPWHWVRTWTRTRGPAKKTQFRWNRKVGRKNCFIFLSQIGGDKKLQSV